MKYYLTCIILCAAMPLFAQNSFIEEKDKCGFDLQKSMEMNALLGDKWGYSYDSLLIDIDYWQRFQQVSVTSLGESTLGRDIFELTITENPVTKSGKPRIYIHARTHPGEVQSFWVTDEIINLLLGNSPLGTFMRQQCIFHIVPMYNPDGVELEKPRENANDIDLESNWGSDKPEQEILVLKNRFMQLMQEENPVQIALNMHSAYDCTRYFVYHHENGTSEAFALKEIDFIESIRQYFISGIKPYNYFVSWTSGTPDYYPESWWWNNYGEEVMALTYEDMNCAAAGDYDKTAFAILRGIADYLDLGYVGIQEYADEVDILIYPNPFFNEIHIQSGEQLQHVSIFNLMGQKVADFRPDTKNLTWDARDYSGNVVAPGFYIINMQTGTKTISKTVVKQ